MSAPVPDARTRFHRILAEIASSPDADALGGLVLDVLSQQAEGRTLFAGPELVASMAAQHGVSAERAQLASANVLTVLSRGPATETEHLLLAGLAVHGLASGTEGPGRVPRLERFSRHAHWLESSTGYEVFPFVDLLLVEADAAHVYRALADALLAEDLPSVSARARNAARLTVLSRSTSPAAIAERDRLAAAVKDPAMRAFAAALREEPLLAQRCVGAAPVPRADEGPSVHGRLDCVGAAPAPRADEGPSVHGRLDVPPPASGLRGLLRLVSGVALFQWLTRLLMAAFGLRSEGAITLTPAGDLRVRRTTWLLGTIIRERDDHVPRAALEQVGRHARYPALTLLVGALALASGVVLGGVFLVDGARSGDTVLLLVGAAVVLAGGVCDLLASTLASGRRGRVSVFVTYCSRGGASALRKAPRQRVCVSGVEESEAERLLSALEAIG